VAVSTESDILIVDDTPANLRLLSTILKDRGYKVRVAPNGPLALAAAQNSPPELILLDITMPELDGFEVCRRLKQDPILAPIPVIFLSALSSTEDKVTAFGAGGVDYITKPFQQDEVCARVETHLRLRTLQVDLEEKIAQLRREEELRESLVHMIVHDLRSPLSGILASLQLVEMGIGPHGARELEDLERAIESGRTMSRMINTLLDVAKIESGEMKLDVQDASLVEVAHEAVRSLGALTRDHRLEVEAPEGPTHARVDRVLIRRVIENLLGNAVRFTPSGGRITIRVRPWGDRSRIEVEDTGIGVPAEFRDRIFEKFGQVWDSPSASSRWTRTAARSASRARRGEAARSGRSSPRPPGRWRLPARPPRADDRRLPCHE
jgi:two-component system sensor histidine kinase/response regulator